jgi:hypothetical protein
VLELDAVTVAEKRIADPTLTVEGRTGEALIETKKGEGVTDQDWVSLNLPTLSITRTL